MIESTTLIAAPAARTDHRHAGRVVARWALPIIFGAVIALAWLTTPGFGTLDNLRAVLVNTSIIGIAAVGMTAITLSGNIFSLGVGPSAMLGSMVFMAVAANGQPVLGVMGALVLMLVIGLVQSLIVAAGLNPVVTTLAVGAIIFGAVSGLTQGQVLSVPGGTIDWIAGTPLLTIPLPVWIFAAFTLVVQLLLDFTTAGRRLVLVGANRQAAVVSGISVRSATIWAFTVMSVGLAIVGVVSASQLGQVTPDNLSSLTVDAVAALLVGGTAVTGGEGSAVRSAAGAIIIVILQNVMLLQGWSSGARVFGEGLLVIAVVAVLHLARKAAAR